MNINLVTNILGFVIAVGGAANAFLQANAGKPVDWVQLVVTLVTAAIAYYTGKSAK